MRFFLSTTEKPHETARNEIRSFFTFLLHFVGYVSCLLYICDTKLMYMDTVIKRQTAFRLNEDLLERLKEAARREHRSLNNYVENVLMKVVYNEPNEETRAAIEEARSGKSAGSLDMSDFRSFMKSVDEIE